MKKLLYKFLSLVIPLVIFSGLCYASNGATVLKSDAGMLRLSVDINDNNLECVNYVSGSEVCYTTVSFAIPFGSTPRIQFISGGHVQLSKVIEIRGRHIINAKVFPQSKQSRNSIEFAVSFSSSKQALTSYAPDPVFDRIFQNSLVNYEQISQFGKPSVRSLAQSSTAAVTPFDISDLWYKISTDRTGICRITGSDLAQAGLSVGSLASDDIRIFAGEGLPLPVSNLISRPEMSEIAIIVNDGGDGTFDSNDEILFYAQALDRWTHNPTDTFVNNPYSEINSYWLTTAIGFSGSSMRMVQQIPAGTVDSIVTSCDQFVHYEQDNMLQRFQNGDIFDYYHWYQTSDTVFTISVPTPAIVPGSSADIYLGGRSNANNMGLEVNGFTASDSSCSLGYCAFTTTNLRNGMNSFRIHQTAHISLPAYFDFLDITYKGYLEPQNDELNLKFGDDDAVIELVVTDNFSSVPIGYDISDPRQPLLLSMVDRSGGNVRFSANLSAGSSNHIYIAGSSRTFAPLAINQRQTTNIRADLSTDELVIITPASFVDAMSEYVDFREIPGRSIRVVAVEDIMDNFSSGLYDPTAIRDYLRYLYLNITPVPPSYVLLVGDGSYDFGDILNTGQANYVPPYIHPFDLAQNYSDDNYVYFGAYGILDSDTTYDTLAFPPDRGYDMITARWPVKTTGEIAVIIDKIKSYESPENLGPWRNSISVVADDEFTSSGSYNEGIHTVQAERLVEEHLPPNFKREKVYMVEYPKVGTKKPGVNDAIVDLFNNGTLLINYIGHGNPDLWAHERVFTRADDLPRLNNYNKLPLVFTASCEIAFFDNPERQGMAEDLLNMSGGGAVAVISATRRVYSGANERLNQLVFDIMFGDSVLTMAQALYTAKLQRQYVNGLPRRVRNDQAYLLLGDPLMRLGIPKFETVFDSGLDSIIALNPTTVSGQIVDQLGQPYSGNGKLFIEVLDSDRDKFHFVLDIQNPENRPLDSISYIENGPSIFRGTATISNGAFDFSFMPPIDIGFGGEGASITGYAVLDGVDAVGVMNNIAIASNVSTVSDAVGPVIEYQFPGIEDFQSGDFVGANEPMIITMTDSSGINLTSSPGHGITLEIDGQSDKIQDLTGNFEYSQDDYMTGQLEYTLADLSVGSHTLKIKAWDNANNYAVQSLEVEVTSAANLAISELLNYPNPMLDSTTFSYYLSSPSSSFSLDIYTVSGRKIKSFTRQGFRQAGYYDDIVWYGNDFNLDRVATGVYIFKAVVADGGGGRSSESYGKVVLIN